MVTWHALLNGDWIHLASLLVTGVFAFLTWRVSNSAKNLAAAQEKNEIRRFHIERFKEEAEKLNQEFSIVFEKYSTSIKIPNILTVTHRHSQREIQEYKAGLVKELVRVEEAFAEFYQKAWLVVHRMFEANRNDASTQVMPWFWFYLSPSLRQELMTGEYISTLYRKINVLCIEQDEKHPREGKDNTSKHRQKFTEKLYSKHLYFRKKFSSVATEYYGISTNSAFMDNDVQELAH